MQSIIENCALSCREISWRTKSFSGHHAYSYDCASWTHVSIQGNPNAVCATEIRIRTGNGIATNQFFTIFKSKCANIPLYFRNSYVRELNCLYKFLPCENKICSAMFSMIWSIINKYKYDFHSHKYLARMWLAEHGDRRNEAHTAWRPNGRGLFCICRMGILTYQNMNSSENVLRVFLVCYILLWGLIFLVIARIQGVSKRVCYITVVNNQ